MRKAVLCDHTADRLMEIHRECNKISKDHNTERCEVVKVAVNALIQHGVRQKESTVTGPSASQHQQHRLQSKEKAQYQLIETLKIVKLVKRKLHKF